MDQERRFSEKEKSRILAVVFITVFLDLVGYGLVFPLLPLYVKSMGGTAGTVGLILSGYAAMQLLTTPIMGKLSDRYGRRRVILLSLFGNALSMIVFALADQVWMIFLSRFLAGATAGNLAACQAVIADVTDKEERARGMGRLGAGIGLGLIMGPVIGGQIAVFGTWAPPAAAAAAALIDLVLAYFWMPETRTPESVVQTEAGTPPVKTPSMWAAFSDPRLLMVMGLFFLTFYCLSNLQVAVALLSDARLSWGEKEVGYIFGLFGVITMLVQGVFIGRLAKAFGELNLVIGGAVCIAVGMGIIAEAHSASVLVIGCLLFAFGVAVTNPSISSLASRYARRDQQGAILGLTQSCGGLARTIGPFVGGVLFESVGVGAPFGVGALVAVVSLGLGLALRRRERQELLLNPPG